MGQTRKLNELTQLLSDFEYPLEREQAAAACDDVTLQFADGTANLQSIIQQSTATAFESASDLEAEVMNHLPRNAVGEPYQSEGEG
jgi:hypothetical protein